MSEPEKSLEKFLERWSRRKLAAAEQAAAKAPDTPDVAEPGQQESAEAKEPAAASAAAPQKFDPASLPSIESISAASDIRAFLAPGVPVELTRAALRRVWVTDPTIRDFIGIAENQWDFTKPDGVPGFGTLEMTQDLRRMVSELVGGPSPEPRPEPDADVAQAKLPAEKSAETTSPDAELASQPPAAAAVEHLTRDLEAVREKREDSDERHDNAAPQNEYAQLRPVEPASPRKHGRALPK